jgi:hypothetical protein
MADFWDTVGGRGKKADEAARKAETRLRERANALLACDAFVDWAGELMRDVGFFGEGRELTPYQQGKRGGIVEAIERVAELADDGDAFLARVFRDRIINNGARNK